MHEEHVPKHLDEITSELARISPALNAPVDAEEYGRRIACGDRVGQLADVEGILHAAGGGGLIEGRERIAGRAIATAGHGLEGFIGEVEFGFGGDLANEFQQRRV